MGEDTNFVADFQKEIDRFTQMVQTFGSLVEKQNQIWKREIESDRERKKALDQREANLSSKQEQIRRILGE